MGRAADPSSWSPRERAAVEKQVRAGKGGRAAEALRKEQAKQKSKDVPFQAGGKVQPTPTDKQRKIDEAISKAREITKEYVRRRKEEATTTERIERAQGELPLFEKGRIGRDVSFAASKIKSSLINLGIIKKTELEKGIDLTKEQRTAIETEIGLPSDRIIVTDIEQVEGGERFTYKERIIDEPVKLTRETVKVGDIEQPQFTWERLKKAPYHFGKAAEVFMAGGGAAIKNLLPITVDPGYQGLPYVGVPSESAIELKRKEAEEFEKFSTVEKLIFIGGGAAAISAVTMPLVKTITPETISVRKTEITKEGTFRGEIITEAGVKYTGEPRYIETKVFGKAQFKTKLPVTKVVQRGRVTGSITTYLDDVYITKGVGISQTGVRTGGTFKFGGLSKDIIQYGDETTTLFKGGYQPTYKLIVKKGTLIAEKVSKKPLSTEAVSISRQIDPTMRVDITKSYAKDPFAFFGKDVPISQDVGVGFTKQVDYFIRKIKLQVPEPSPAMGGTSRVFGAGFDKAISAQMQSLAVSIKADLPVTTRYAGIPFISPIFKTDEVTKQAFISRDTTTEDLRESVQEIAKSQFIQLEKERQVIKGRTGMRVIGKSKQDIFTLPTLKSALAERESLGVIQKQKIDTIEGLMQKQVLRGATALTPVMPTLPFLQSGYAIPFFFALPNLRFPSAVPRRAAKTRRKFEYTPSLVAAELGIFGEEPKGELTLQLRPISKGYKKFLKGFTGGKLI